MTSAAITAAVGFDDDDQRDGQLFRYWIIAASLYPGETAEALLHATTPGEYRAALEALAVKHGVNLPPPPPKATELLKPAAELVQRLQETLAEVVSSMPFGSMAARIGCTQERAAEIRRLAGL